MTGEEIAAALDTAAEDGPPVPAPVPVAAGRAPRRVFASWGEAFAEQTVTVEGGHVHWTGATGQKGTPMVAFGGQVQTAYRIAFRWHYGREPIGNVRPTCGYPACVAGGHLADRWLREGGRS